MLVEITIDFYLFIMNLVEKYVTRSIKFHVINNYKDGIYSKQEITNRIMETLDINNDKNKDHIHDFIYEVVEQVILMISRGTDTDPNIYKLINWHGKL